MAGEFESAHNYCSDYLNDGEREDPLIQNVLETLNSGGDPALALNYFSQN